MKILIIHTKYTNIGGEDKVVEQETKLLKQQHRVKTLYFKNKKGFYGLLQFVFSVWNIKSAYIVKKKIKEFKPDLIHVHNWHFASGPIIIRVAKKNGIKVINTLHNYRLLCPSAILLYKNKLFLNSLNQAFPWDAVRLKVYKDSFLLTFWLAFVVWFHRKIGTWKMVNTFICLTPTAIDFFQNTWIGQLNNKITSKPNFLISENTSNEKARKREDHFIFIGRLSEEKGIKLLIEAFQKLPYKLKIAGDGPLKHFVEEETQRNSNILYLGRLNKNEVLYELKKANALIFPSIWLEPFGLVIIEAFSNSCSVIASNIGAPSSTIVNGQNGFHFKSGNVNNLRGAIKIWQELQPSEKEKIRKNALKAFQKKYASSLQHQYFDKIHSNVLNTKF